MALQRNINLSCQPLPYEAKRYVSVPNGSSVRSLIGARRKHTVFSSHQDQAQNGLRQTRMQRMVRCAIMLLSSLWVCTASQVRAISYCPLSLVPCHHSLRRMLPRYTEFRSSTPQNASRTIKIAGVVREGWALPHMTAAAVALHRYAAIYLKHEMARCFCSLNPFILNFDASMASPDQRKP